MKKECVFQTTFLNSKGEIVVEDFKCVLANVICEKKICPLALISFKAGFWKKL